MLLLLRSADAAANVVESFDTVTVTTEPAVAQNPVVTASGTLSVSFATTGTARKTAARVGSVGLSYAQTGTARKVTARSGTAGVGYYISGQEIALRRYRPSADTVVTGWTFVGATAAWQALSDSSNASYVTVS